MFIGGGDMKTLSIFALLLVSAVIAFGTILTIDDFTSINYGTNPEHWSYEFTRTATGTETQEAIIFEDNLSDVVGGTRTTKLTCAPHTYVYSQTYTNNAGFDGGVWTGNYNDRDGFFISNGDSMNGEGKFELTYKVGSLDMTEAALVVEIKPDHVGFGKNTVASLTLDDGSVQETIDIVWNSYQSFSDYFDLVFSAHDFGSVDVTDVRNITFAWECDLANDLSVDKIYVEGSNIVPEPATMAVLGLGSLICFVRRK